MTGLKIILLGKMAKNINKKEKPGEEGINPATKEADLVTCFCLFTCHYYFFLNKNWVQMS